MKKYINRFFKEEDGAELLEWAIGIAITAMLIGLVMVIYKVVKNKTLDAGEQIEEAGGNSSTTTDWQGEKEDVDAALDALG